MTQYGIHRTAHTYTFHLLIQLDYSRTLDFIVQEVHAHMLEHLTFLLGYPSQAKPFTILPGLHDQCAGSEDG